jgi:hypothetical protein
VGRAPQQVDYFITRQLELILVRYGAGATAQAPQV